MVQIPGGKMKMGTSASDGRDGESPVKDISVAPFSIDIHPVTNLDFRWVSQDKNMNVHY